MGSVGNNSARMQELARSGRALSFGSARSTSPHLPMQSRPRSVRLVLQPVWCSVDGRTRRHAHSVVHRHHALKANATHTLGVTSSRNVNNAGSLKRTFAHHGIVSQRSGQYAQKSTEESPSVLKVIQHRPGHEHARGHTAQPRSTTQASWKR